MAEKTLNASAYEVSGPIVTVPTQTINLGPQNYMVGIQVQQIKTAGQQPVRPVTPINVQKTPLSSSTNVQLRVQFMRDPADNFYSGTSVLIQTPIGTTALQATSGNGPIVFSAAKGSPFGSSIAIQTNNTNGTSSSNAFGNGNSNKLNLT